MCHPAWDSFTAWVRSLMQTSWWEVIMQPVSLPSFCRPVMVTWVRVDDEMPQHAVLSGPNLFINNLNKTDNGTYRCEASNRVGKAHSDYMLYVYGT